MPPNCWGQARARPADCWRPTASMARPRWPTATGAAVPTTPLCPPRLPPFTSVVELATGRYEGANHTHCTELLREREGIDLSRPTVRRILTRAGIGSPRSQRSPQHRFRRQRMPQAGMLVQLDGSHHAWLEDRGPKFALLLAVDDATGAVVNAVFRPSEDTAGYFMLLEGLIEGWGIPLALYSDRHAVFKHNARKPETAAATQFTRSFGSIPVGGRIVR